MTVKAYQILKQIYCSPKVWAYGKYFISNSDYTNCYMRNDGKLFSSMQTEPLDTNGGTYFLTHQDAQDCLDRYNARQEVSTVSSNTQQINNVQSTTPMVRETEGSN